MGNSAITKINLGVPAYVTTFADGNLAAGILTVSHNLNAQYLSVTIYDNNDKIIIPDDVTATDANTSTIDLSSYGTIAGTWRVVILDTGATAYINPIATDLLLSGQSNGDIATYNGANWVAQAPSGLYKVLDTSRDMTTATGTQAITGVGFQPKMVVCMAAIAFTVTGSWGACADDASTGHAFSQYATAGPAFAQTSTLQELVWAQVAHGTDSQSAFVQSWDSDGITLSWLKTGLPTGTLTVHMEFYG